MKYFLSVLVLAALLVSGKSFLFASTEGFNDNNEIGIYNKCITIKYDKKISKVEQIEDFLNSTCDLSKPYNYMVTTVSKYSMETEGVLCCLVKK